MLWTAVVLACALSFALKYLGHRVPESWLAHPRAVRINSLLPIVLLASLTAVQAAGGNGGIVLDARIPALLVAGVLLWRRAPFIVVVATGAATAALIRFVLP